MDDGGKLTHLRSSVALRNRIIAAYSYGLRFSQSAPGNQRKNALSTSNPLLMLDIVQADSRVELLGKLGKTTGNLLVSGKKYPKRAGPLSRPQRDVSRCRESGTYPLYALAFARGR